MGSAEASFFDRCSNLGSISLLKGMKDTSHALFLKIPAKDRKARNF
jgi:hypothetical protein